MNLQEINDLSFDNMGDWPALAKILLVLIIIGAMGAGWYYWQMEGQYLALQQVKGVEQELKTEFERKQAKAVNLEAYKEQLKEMEESFGAMLRQLPDKTEVAGLLVDVSQTGLAAGLEFELFQPLGEVRQDFYAELPIKVRVIGAYHEFGEFVSGLAALPRIVTIHDVKIMRREGLSKLVLEATAKTYRYLEEEG